MTTDSPYGDHLPIFPLLAMPVTEDRIERTACRLADRADAAFMAGKATQAQYDAWHKALDAWADRQYLVAAKIAAITAAIDANNAGAAT